MQISVEGDGHQEGKHESNEENWVQFVLGILLPIMLLNILGESAPSERQVSPEKRYRAALLIGRFADTILKAREKTKVGSPTLVNFLW